MCCVYIYLLQKDTHTFASLMFCKNLEDIQMILQQSECIFATNIHVCEQNMIPTCNFMFMQHNWNVIPTRLVFKFKDF